MLSPSVACSLVTAVSAPVVDSFEVVSVAVVDSFEVVSEIVAFGSEVDLSPVVLADISDDGEEFDILVYLFNNTSVSFADSPSEEWSVETDSSDSVLEELFADRSETFTSLELVVMKPVTLP